MFHSGTSALIYAWNALPNAGRVPSRADFDPMLLASYLPRLWTAQRFDGDRWTLRLAGGWIERLHGGPLAGADWSELWRSDCRLMILAAIQRSVREATPVVLLAESPLLSGPIEVCLAPLRDPSGAADRLIGLYQPLDTADLGAEAVGPLSARHMATAGHSRRAPLSLATLDGRRIA